MIDWIKSKIEIPSNRIPENVFHQYKAPFEWQGVTFYPADNGTFKADARSIKENGLGGLYVSIHGQRYPSLIVANSLHKFYHNGINHNDFTLSEINAAIEMLSDYLGLNFFNAELVGAFEFSANLDVPNPMEYTQNLIKYKGKEPTLMKGNNKVYGKRFELGAYYVKAYLPYDKAKMMREPLPINENLLRTEIRAKKLSYLRKRGIDIHTMQDLTERPKMQKLGEILSNYFSLVKHEKVLPSDLSRNDLFKYYFYRNASKKHLNYMSEISSKVTKKRDDQALERIYAQSESVKTWFEEIPKRINEKWNVLLNS